MADNLIVSTDEQKLLEGVDPDKGFSGDFTANKPVLLFKGIEKDILADGFMLLIGHGAKNYLTDYVKSRKGVTELKKGMFFKKRDEVEDFVKQQLKEPTGTFPDIDKLIPERESWTGELTPVGSKDVAVQGDDRKFVYLTDGSRIIGVDAEKYSFLKGKLPNAKVHGQREYELSFPDETAESIGKSKNVYLDKLNPESPLTFVVGDKVAGVLMPVYLDSIPDGVKQKAATLPVTTKSLGGSKKKARNSGTIDIDKPNGAVDLVSYMSRMERMGNVKIFDGGEKDYKGQGDFYIRVVSKDISDHVMAWNDESIRGRRKKFESHDVPRLEPVSKVVVDISLQAIHDSRSTRSRESDERLSNADTIEPDDPRVDIWERDPGRMDVVGIDTPRKGKSSKSKKPVRKSKRTGRVETQVRGVRR